MHSPSTIQALFDPDPWRCRAQLCWVGINIEPDVYRAEDITGFCLAGTLIDFSGEQRTQWGFDGGGIGVVEILPTDLAFGNEADCGSWATME